MEFQYIATTGLGKIKKGTVEARSRREVVRQLQRKKLIIVSINDQISSKKSSSGTARRDISLGRVSMLDRIIFSRNLAVMLRAGLSLAEALDAIIEQTPSKKMQQISEDVLKSVSNGETLSRSLQKHPKVFGPMVTGMVKVGEASGTLEKNLEYTATVLEKDYELWKKVKSAMLYPAIVLMSTLALGIGMTIFILPKLVRMFDTFRIDLPPITSAFLAIANFLVDYGIFVLILFIGCVIGIRILMKAKSTKPFFHNLYLHIPIIKKLSKTVNIARLARVMAILLKSGVTINESLTIAGGVVSNVHYSRQLNYSMAGIQQGKTLASSLSNDKYFPKMASRMIGEGEKTGNLAESFSYLADFYEKELDSATKNLSTMLEPILLVVIGVVLGFLAIAIISPIYQFTGQIRG